MRRSTLGLILTLALGILAAPLAAHAQQAGKVFRIGYLAGRAPLPSAEEAFRQGLHELGWIEGQNIAIEYRFAGGNLDQLPELAAELVRLKVDILVTVAAPPPLAAKRATGTIPIVMLGVGDPVGTGIVASLTRPGGNITGVSHLVGFEILGKRLELLKEAVPNLTRVAVLWNPANPPEALAFRQLQAAARQLGVTLQSIEVREPKEFENAFAAITRGRTDALLVFEGPLANAYREQIVQSRQSTDCRQCTGSGSVWTWGASCPIGADHFLKIMLSRRSLAWRADSPGPCSSSGNLPRVPSGQAARTVASTWATSASLGGGSLHALARGAGPRPAVRCRSGYPLDGTVVTG